MTKNNKLNYIDSYENKKKIKWKKEKSEFKPLFVYDNLLLNKSIIFNQNKNKSGIYRWVNKINNESYIGSSINLTIRLKVYFSIKILENKVLIDTSRIYRALLKYGHSNFKLEILEHCNEKSVINREQYYLDNIKPEYNILKIAGSNLGFKHSLDTLLKFKNRKLGIITGCSTIVINIHDFSVKEYYSIRETARKLNVSNTTLLYHIDINKVLKNTYLIFKTKFKSTSKVELNLPYENKDKHIKIFNYSNNTINEFSNKKGVARYLSKEYNIIISVTTISIYIKSGKLYKNKYKIYI
uniref:GIY-YIG endonuclease n=1 Tax=Tolypocladium cylindrosporum TaxID=38005 RepID=A0A6G7P012_9HYPO|nr:GIY-YIG endonuclease [Tolypocladium cylindrosporum]QIJ60558.1 GIY-YIG endonuclease [Tolypocladium cylindrosporum]